MSHLPRKPRLFDEGCERPAAIVVVASCEIDDGLALHIGLPGEDEDFYGLLVRRDGRAANDAPMARQSVRG